MFFSLISAVLAVQPAAVIAEMQVGPQAMLRAEVLQRPAGTAPAAFIASLAQDAGAGGWQRVEREMEGPPFRFVLTGFRNPAGGSPLAFYSVAGEDASRPGRVCRVRMRERPGSGEGDEVARVSQFCLRQIAPPAAAPQR